MFRISDRSKDYSRLLKQQPTSQSGHRSKYHKPLHNTVMTTQVSRACPFCGTEGHVTRNCSKFLALSVSDRNSEAKRLKLCFNYLANNHSSHSCPSKRTCRYSNSRHHSILHRENRTTTVVRRQIPSSIPAATEPAAPAPQAAPTDPETRSTPARMCHIRDSGLGSKTILPTIKVLVQGKNEIIVVRGLVDTGAALSCTTRRLAHRVRAKKEKLNTHVLAFGSTEAATCNEVTTLQLSALFDSTQTVIGGLP